MNATFIGIYDYHSNILLDRKPLISPFNPEQRLGPYILPFFRSPLMFGISILPFLRMSFIPLILYPLFFSIVHITFILCIVITFIHSTFATRYEC